MACFNTIKKLYYVLKVYKKLNQFRNRSEIEYWKARRTDPTPSPKPLIIYKVARPEYVNNSPDRILHLYHHHRRHSHVRMWANSCVVAVSERSVCVRGVYTGPCLRTTAAPQLHYRPPVRLTWLSINRHTIVLTSIFRTFSKKIRLRCAAFE